MIAINMTGRGQLLLCFFNCVYLCVGKCVRHEKYVEIRGQSGVTPHLPPNLKQHFFCRLLPPVYLVCKYLGTFPLCLLCVYKSNGVSPVHATIPSYYVGAEDPNRSPHACTASVLVLSHLPRPLTTMQKSKQFLYMGFAQTQCKLARKTNLDFKQELGNMENNFASIIGKEKKE